VTEKERVNLKFQKSSTEVAFNPTCDGHILIQIISALKL